MTIIILSLSLSLSLWPRTLHVSGLLVHYLPLFSSFSFISPFLLPLATHSQSFPSCQSFFLFLLFFLLSLSSSKISSFSFFLSIIFSLPFPTPRSNLPFSYTVFLVLSFLPSFPLPLIPAFPLPLPLHLPSRFSPFILSNQSHSTWHFYFSGWRLCL